MKIQSMHSDTSEESPDMRALGLLLMALLVLVGCELPSSADVAGIDQKPECHFLFY